MIKEGGIFNKYSSKTRMLLFYCICIWVRLFIAFTIYKYSNNKILLYLILLFSIISIYLNFSKLNEKVWWSRLFHGIISVLLLVFAIIIILRKNNLVLINSIFKNNKILSYLIVIDILFGFFYSLYIKPFI
jgi:hypothetical protein